MTDAKQIHPSAKIISLASYVDTHSPHGNVYGEQALKGAPLLQIRDDLSAVPQQFFKVERTVENVEAILSDIEFSADYPLFVGSEGSVIYIQVGIIGAENYPGCKQPLNSAKIVYGRKWLIESATPTSEVIQTVFLAIKKAREHELREHLYFMSDDKKHFSTPFNTHVDLPLLTQIANSHPQESVFGGNLDLPNNLADLLRKVRFGRTTFKLRSLTAFDDNLNIASIELKSNDLDGGIEAKLFPEFAESVIPIVYKSSDANGFLHALIDGLIQCSDRYVQEQFTFKGFARFSQTVGVQQIAEFSIKTRNVGTQSNDFTRRFRAMNTQVDSQRAPKLNKSTLGIKQLNKINRFANLEGHVPT